jgi:hypothetical protein
VVGNRTYTSLVDRLRGILTSSPSLGGRPKTSLDDTPAWDRLREKRKCLRGPCSAREGVRIFGYAVDCARRGLAAMPTPVPSSSYLGGFGPPSSMDHPRDYFRGRLEVGLFYPDRHPPCQAQTGIVPGSIPRGASSLHVKCKALTPNLPTWAAPHVYGFVSDLPLRSLASARSRSCQ